MENNYTIYILHYIGYRIFFYMENNYTIYILHYIGYRIFFYMENNYVFNIFGLIWLKERLFIVSIGFPILK
jgi:hypothetical protein